MHFSLSRPRAAAAATAVVALGAGLAATQAPSTAAHLRPQVGSAGSESVGVSSALSERDQARTAPTGSVAPGAYENAANQFAALPTTNLGAHNITNVPYNSDDPNYRDPAASNSGGGAGYVTGRIQGVAVDGSTIYAGGAAGGVWRSTDNGANWTPISDGSDPLPAQSIGVLKLNGGSLWVATGDGTTGSGTYAGNGVWVSTDPTSSSPSWTQVGNIKLDGTIIRSLVFSGDTVFAATSTGVYSHSVSALTGDWRVVLQPCEGNGTAPQSCSDVNSAYRDIANDLAVDPNNPQHILANVAWRSGAAYNGFYESTNGGAWWTKVNPTGALPSNDVGNTTFAYSHDGSKLYAVVESPKALNAGQATALGGVYVSKSGSVTGPWTQSTNSKNLSTSGSAEKVSAMGHGYQPGVQAWYNQFLAVDPHDANHVYLGLEEVYESRDGGNSWTTIGRYWNFGLSCYPNHCDGNVLHSDQHAIAFGASKIYVGNDGGLYSRAIDDNPASWTSLSASGKLDTLQYYSVGVGHDSSGGYDVWGGLQDNGVSLIRGSSAQTMVSPFGGDGGDQLVDAADGCKTVGEYVYLYLQMTKNCGQTDGSTSAVTVIAPSDPNPRFTAPFGADRTDPEHLWVAGGEYVWKNTKTWDTTSGSDWTKVGDTGGSITSIDSRGGTIWAGWCGGCNPGSSFKNGLVDTIGGFHQVALGANVPKRMITAVEADPANPNGAYVVFGGFSRSWVTGPGDYAAGQGHVYYVTDDGNGNVAWTNVSEGMPDVPADSIRVAPDGSLLVGTDLGLLEKTAGGTWLRVSDVPMTVVSKIVDAPDGNVYFATFGRGLYEAASPA